MVQKPQGDAGSEERRIDLSLPQVAGSAVAAVAAAVMASQLGVYGTIAGAGVMSVVATCGGSVFQHFFRRTGEQIREVTVQVKHPGGRQVTVRTRDTVPAAPKPQDDATTVLRTARPDRDATEGVTNDPERTQLLGAVGPCLPGAADPERTRLLRRVDPESTQLLRRVDPESTQLLGRVDPQRTQLIRNDPERTQLFGQEAAGPPDVYSEAHTHGTRVRGWKRPALAAVAVFAVSMGGITVYELASGNDLSGGGGTTVGSVVRGGHGATTTDPAPTSSTDPERSAGPEDREPGADSSSAPATDPGDGQSSAPGSGDGDTSTTEPDPAPSTTGGSTAPEPTGSAAPEDSAPASPDPTASGDAPTGEAGTGEGQEGGQATGR
ncbi:hypothetical protein [Streptomyces sp. B1I3]|uniref:hypothetical protein n=1 Tax=Streptomyces sp. B1I3 TaxID=3042264 RepID=UPI0027D87F87|nr:hypothetical protein [Streptomyces sp. B1I3]